VGRPVWRGHRPDIGGRARPKSTSALVLDRTRQPESWRVGGGPPLCGPHQNRDRSRRRHGRSCFKV